MLPAVLTALRRCWGAWRPCCPRHRDPAYPQARLVTGSGVLAGPDQWPHVRLPGVVPIAPAAGRLLLLAWLLPACHVGARWGPSRAMQAAEAIGAAAAPCVALTSSSHCRRSQGVAYVKYDRASSAALAIENLHEVTLNDGQGPRLKVLLADSPHTR